MKDVTILKAGTIVATYRAPPILVPSAAGLSAWIGSIKYVLLPGLVLFLGVTAYGL